MSVIIRKYTDFDIPSMKEIWNEVVLDGVAFPQIETLDDSSAKAFFLSQTYCGVAENEETKVILGLYILHPNNVGRCSHICNCSYAVSSKARGRGIGESLVRDSILQGKREGFKILQFNAVVATNKTALKLYEKIGFLKLGVIPKGFLMKDGHYEDIIPHYIEL